jgi:hypothetical protein
MDPNDLIALIFGGSILITIASVVLSILCTVVPIGLVVWYLVRRSRMAKEARLAARSWEITSGRVLKSYVDVRESSHMDANNVMQSSTSYDPKVLYEYDVDGKTFQGQTIRVGDSFFRVSAGGSSEAQKVVDRYPEGSEVYVYYNPDNPAESALEKA